MARINPRFSLPLMAAALGLAFAAPACAQGWYLAPQYSLDGHTVDYFDASQVRWFKSQALYWRRQEFSSITKLAGTKEYYRKADLIGAQVQLDYAKVDLEVVKDPQQAAQDLEQAMALVASGSTGAGKAEMEEIKQVTDELDRIKGQIASLKPAGKDMDKAGDDLAGAADALKRIVVSG